MRLSSMSEADLKIDRKGGAKGGAGAVGEGEEEELGAIPPVFGS